MSYGTAGVGTGAGTAGPATNLYKCPNLLTEEYDVFTNAGPGAAFRAPGHPQGCFALEQAIDELADKLNMDPLDSARQDRRESGAPGGAAGHPREARTGGIASPPAADRAQSSAAWASRSPSGTASSTWIPPAKCASRRTARWNSCPRCRTSAPAPRRCWRRSSRRSSAFLPPDVVIRIGDTRYPDRAELRRQRDGGLHHAGGPQRGVAGEAEILRRSRSASWARRRTILSCKGRTGRLQGR